MKIPDDRKPSYEVTIKGVKNSFAPSTEVSGDVASALFGTENFPPAPPETDKPFNIPIPASGGGGRTPMTVTISRSWDEEEEKYVYTADKTVDEMIEQIEAGGQLFSNFWNGMGSPVMRYHVTEEAKGVVFYTTGVLQSKVTTVNVSIINAGSGDVVNVQERTYPNS